MTPTTYWAEHAWLGSTVEPDVTITVGADGRITGATPGAGGPPPGSETLRGLTLPGLANAHSHAFHRALRGTVQVGSGTFWTWRETMYQFAARLTPDTYYTLARAVYAEMALAGITCVGEFHYLHHAPGGERYADPNAMGAALIAAAAAAGIRVTLLDTAYLASGFGVRGTTGRGGPAAGGAPPDRHQLRFSDGTADAWAERVSELKPREHARIGAAIHSVRAVPAGQLPVVAAWARERGAPLHVHLSEQPAENRACAGAHGLSPTALLAAEGVLSPSLTAVHATHLDDEDIGLLGRSRTRISMCCTTERDLADGVGPAVRLAAAGSPLCVGSDAHMAIDLWEEVRAIELDERLVSGSRGHLRAEELLRAATADGSAALGWDAGHIAVGRPADLTTVRLDSPRTAGARSGDVLAHAVFAATAADVSTVLVGGRSVVTDGHHLTVADPGAALEEAIARALGAGAPVRR
ncbi:MAG TPA: formimidoylglutamate deiminase [Streptomyces sp.]|nr:formimidoylglutamate deiminase [Streptomyces sp.]